MERKHAEVLWNKYLEETCNLEEKAIVESWLLNYMENNPVVPDEEEFLHAQERIFKRLPTVKNKRLKIQRWFFAAATVTLGCFCYYLYYNLNTRVPDIRTSQVHNIMPGTNKAILTLANGKKINLSDHQTRIVINETNIAYADGTVPPGLLTEKELIDVSKKALSDKAFLMINIPKGGTYQLELPDGTLVWLNAASTLKFPSSFTGLKQRKVELNGEAYFEVASNKKIPFIVNIKKQQVKVLGTRFNINSYPDEPSVKTTLLEGSVEVSDAIHFKTLRQGEQSISSGSGILVRQVDPENDVAWKNGEFMFSKEPLESIMRKVSRWYNVEVVYEDNQVGNKPFGGSISKFEKVSDVLGMLELTGEVHFKIEGRRITVMN